MKGSSDAAGEADRTLGRALPDWVPPAPPARLVLDGDSCSLVPVHVPLHARALFDAFAEDQAGRDWRYLPYGPFARYAEFESWLNEQSSKADPLFFSVVERASGLALGLTSFMRINPAMGVAEIGHIHFSPRLQRTVAATEALYLMLDDLFRLGYRRCEWKCNALNAASRRAALRLGFRYEGTFRQAAVIKGRNRDTAWYALLDHQWPEIKTAFETWLAPANFVPDGQQRQRLSMLTRQARQGEDSDGPSSPGS